MEVSGEGANAAGGGGDGPRAPEDAPAKDARGRSRSRGRNRAPSPCQRAQDAVVAGRAAVAMAAQAAQVPEVAPGVAVHPAQMAPKGEVNFFQVEFAGARATMILTTGTCVIFSFGPGRRQP